MRLAAFDPRVRTLSGLAYSARQRYLSALHCQAKQMGRLRGLPFADGNWNRLGRLRGFRGLGQGDVAFEPTMYDPGNTLTPPTPAPGQPLFLLPQAINPQTGLPVSVSPIDTTMYNPTTGLTAPSAVPLSSAPGQPALTAAQVAQQAASITSLIANPSPNVVPNTTLGIPNQYFVYGGVALLGVMLLGSLGRKR